MKCFNWDSNILDIENNIGIRIILKLKGNKTIISGGSATGKTLLCNVIKGYKDSFNDSALSKYNVDNIFILDRYNKSELKNQEHKLIIIDRAELILEESDVDIINDDTDINKYIIISRKPLGIDLSPNYYAELIKKDNRIELDYAFNIRGWN